MPISLQPRAATAAIAAPASAASIAAPAAEDDAIALRAAHLITPHTTLGLGAGRITLRIARALARTPGLTVVTSSPAIALAFDEHEAYGQQIVLVGGLVTPAGGCVGSIARATIRQLAVDRLILHIAALDSTRGLLSPTHLQAETDRAMIDAARELVVVANHSAWNAVALAPIVPLDAVTALVTSTGLAADAQAVASAAVGELHLVDVPGAQMLSDVVHYCIFSSYCVQYQAGVLSRSTHDGLVRS